MEKDNKQYYYFSTEGYSSELPIQVVVLKKLKTKEGREAILVECKKTIKDYGTKYLVLIPKQLNDSYMDLDESKAIYSFVINGSKYVDSETIDLAGGSKMIIDWGGICLSYEIAKKMQYLND